PVPAAQRVGVQRLLWVEHEKAVLIGQLIHTRTLRESVCVLTATVQHYQKRHALAPADRGGDIQKVIALSAQSLGAQRMGEAAGDPTRSQRGTPRPPERQS